MFSLISPSVKRSSGQVTVTRAGFGRQVDDGGGGGERREARDPLTRGDPFRGDPDRTTLPRRRRFAIARITILMTDNDRDKLINNGAKPIIIALPGN